jgi:hypothetical protein
MRAHAQTQEVRIGSLLRWVLVTIIRLVSVASATSRAGGGNAPSGLLRDRSRR